MTADAPDPIPLPHSSPPKEHGFGAAAASGLVPIPAQPEKLHISPIPTARTASTNSAKLKNSLRCLWRDLCWNIRLIYRFLRPKAKPFSKRVAKAAATLLRRVLAPLLSKENWSLIWSWICQGTAFLSGWLIWYWRRIKTNRDTRLATLGLIGGFSLPLIALIMAIIYLPSNPATVDLPIDPSVPAPDIIALAEDEATTDSSENFPQETPQAPALSPDNFRFELFVQRRPDGQIKMLHKVAEGYARRWFPVGTPVTHVLRFVGDVLIRSGIKAETSAEAAKSRCIALPINRVFRQNTITCTYGHLLPGPALPHENAKLRMFWIITMTNDSAGRLTDLRIHARTTEARP